MSRYYIFGKQVKTEDCEKLIKEIASGYNVIFVPSSFTLDSYCYLYETKKGRYMYHKKRYTHFATIHIS